MKNHCDFNVVLISAATVLLTSSIMTNTNTALAFISSTQIQRNALYYDTTAAATTTTNHHQHHPYSKLNSHLIIRHDDNPKMKMMRLYSSRRNKNQESWSKRAAAISTSSSTSSSSTSSSSSSSSSTTKLNESRFGVRRRVRKVLEKAKQRTGIRNNSEDDDDLYSNSSNRKSSGGSDFGGSSMFKPSPSSSTPSPKPRPIKTTSTIPNVVADAASIGGLGAVVVDDESGRIDVAFDYIAPEVEEEQEAGNNLKTNKGRAEMNEDKNNVDNEKNIDRGEETQRASEVIKDMKTSEGTTQILAVKSSTQQTSSSKPSSVTTVKKSSPASTYSPSLIRPKPEAEDILVPAKPSSNATKGSESSKASSSQSTTPSKRTIPEVDALKGDVSAAFSMPPPPLPFTLPDLTPEQYKLLLEGERVQFQSDMGREGSGFIAVDVKAPASVIWECLLDFYSYPETIPTVRDIQMFTNTHLAQDYYAETVVDKQKYEDGTLATLKHGIPSVTRAAFTLSKFRLKIAAIHKYRTHPQGDYMIFTLDPACTNVVLQNAKGVWHTQSNPDGRGEEYTRVWLLCELKVSPFLPKWIVDYAAKKAMPRASSWIKPHCEAAAELWYKELYD